MSLFRRNEWRLALLLLLLLTGVAHAQDGTSSPDASHESQSSRGRIIGEGGRPVAGALVRAAVLRATGTYGGEILANSNREGEFELKDVPPGLTEVLVLAPPLLVVEGIPGGGARPGDVLTIRMAKGAAITGKVVDENGAPLTGLRVTPELVRNESGVRPAGEYEQSFGGLVDDRGVYRLYGLRPGNYVLSAGRATSNFERPVFLSDRPPTYYPSASRSAASEVSVRLGSEVLNIDIVFRSDAGYRIEGQVVGAGAVTSSWTVVEVFRSRESESYRSIDVESEAGSATFYVDGVEDGDYELMAMASGTGDGPVSSDRVRVRVRGSDVSGVTLPLMPMSQITGRVELYPEVRGEECAEAGGNAPARPIRLGSVAIGIRKVAPAVTAPERIGLKADGTFAAARLTGSKYRLWAEFADDEIFVVRFDLLTAVSERSGDAVPKRAAAAAVDRTIASAAAPSAATRDGVNVSRGKSVDGLRFVVARGAARVRGRIAPAKEGEPLPSRLRVCLVPADPKQKDDVVHYYEVDMDRDGSFDFRNVAPGEYLVMTRVFPNDDRPDLEMLPAAWNEADRTKLRASAEKDGIRVTLSPCQRLESAVVRIPSVQ